MSPVPEPELKIEVICENLPAHCGADPILLGIQRGREVIDVVPAATGRAVFHAAFKVADADGQPKLLGPFAQGAPAERFFYLSWGTKGSDGRFEMFRRLKVHLRHLTWRKIKPAVAQQRRVRVTLDMTDEKGGARCGSAQDETVAWQYPP